jgi:cytochrome d ubiquinol oxidase subunit I
LRTGQSASPLAAPAVASSLAAFAVVYAIVFVSGIFYILRLMSQPPHAHETGVASSARVRGAGIAPVVAIAPDRTIPDLPGGGHGA